MDTLFNTDEFFQKERPTEPTKSQIDAFYDKMASEMIDSGFTTNDKEDIIEDLKDLYMGDSGFEMAKDLYDNSGYEVDSELVAWLENLPWKYRDLKNSNVREWVKCHNPQPIFERGQKLIANKELCYKKNKGIIVYVTGFKEDVASYLISEDPSTNGGTVLAYELVEERCTVVNE